MLSRFLIATLAFVVASSPSRAKSGSFADTVLPFLESHCLACHGKDQTKGEVDFSQIRSMQEAVAHTELWETVSMLVEDGEMPPKDEPQPTAAERKALLSWIEDEFFGQIESAPAVFQPRRLSAPEYRNTLRSLLGFDLEVNIAEAEQTIAETSLVLKLLPTDPPGASGFINDTRQARISTTIWDQYSYLADSGLNRFLEEAGHGLDPAGAEQLLRDFTTRAFRRPVSEEQLSARLKHISDKTGAPLRSALEEELKLVLMSPAFLYRGFLAPMGKSSGRHAVDGFELAERLSYFLWEDMPDAELFDQARDGSLLQAQGLRKQVDRMLDSPRSRTLASSFAQQWLLLDQIHHGRNDPPFLHALQNQPLEFIHYLIVENRPITDLIDSEVTFLNSNIGNYYGADRKRIPKFIKPKGIERMIMPLEKVTLEDARQERGAGILTMPGVLAMNEGPILRGTWMLRQILGEHLGEPPPDVPPIQAAGNQQDLTFREKFERHRADQSCALCHDKIDPLGFALEGYDDSGGVVGKNQSKKKKGTATQSLDEIDTSGQLPDGQRFANFFELQQLLLTSEREKIIRNVVEEMLAYALCRKLERSDRPTVDALTKSLMETNGTWRDLIHGVTESVPFTEAIFEAN